MIPVLSKELEYTVENHKYEKLEIMQPRINRRCQLVNKTSWISPHKVLQTWLINTVKWRIIRGRGRGLKREGALLTFFPWKGGGGGLLERGGLNRTGSRFSACSLIELIFSNLLLLLSINNPTHMYLGNLRVYFTVEVYFRVTWSRTEEYRKN